MIEIQRHEEMLSKAQQNLKDSQSVMKRIEKMIRYFKVNSHCDKLICIFIIIVILIIVVIIILAIVGVDEDGEYINQDVINTDFERFMDSKNSLLSEIGIRWLGVTALALWVLH